MDALLALHARGVSVQIEPECLVVSPSRLMQDDERAAILADKPNLLRLPALLTKAIHRCCNARGDDETNRVSLIVECLALPAWEQRELLEHFEDEAARWEAANRGEARA